MKPQDRIYQLVPYQPANPIQAAHHHLPRLRIGEAAYIEGVRIERTTYGYAIGHRAPRSLLQTVLMLQHITIIERTCMPQYAAEPTNV